MSKDKTLDMARESWLAVYGLGHHKSSFIEALKHFEALVRADERETCAKVCDKRYMGDNNREDMEAKECATAIRARGNT